MNELLEILGSISLVEIIPNLWEVFLNCDAFAALFIILIAIIIVAVIVALVMGSREGGYLS